MQTVADSRCLTYELHMKGTPQQNATHTDYEHLLNDVLYLFFQKKLAKAHAHALTDVINWSWIWLSKNLAKQKLSETHAKLDLFKNYRKTLF